MLSLIYVSTAVLPFDTDDLTLLVAEAAARNFEHRITGLLAFNGINFMQLLEGPDVAVEERMARIAADPRHTGVVVVRRRSIERRECEHWSMTGRVLPVGGLGPDGPNALLPEFEPDTRQIFSGFATIAA